jgi:hypothetical protein
MKGLAGDFSTMPLKDLIVYLWNRKSSGTLALERNQVRKQVLVSQGWIINALSNSAREYLGQFMINLGLISEEQFNNAFETQKETKVLLGRILVMTGAVSEPQLQHTLSLKFRETVLEAFDWPQGVFSFVPEARIQIPDNPEMRVPLVELHKEADLRAEAWEKIRKIFPRGDCALSLAKDGPSEVRRPGTIDEKICTLIKGGVTVRELALKLHATDFLLFNRLYALHHMGAIRVDEKRSSEIEIEVDVPNRDEASLEDLVHNARTFLAQGQYRDCHAVITKALEMDADVQALEVRKELEREWLPILRRDILGSKKVGVMAMDANELARAGLSAQERYLISRLDGKRDVDSVVRIAPIGEFEALTLLDRFVFMRWVILGTAADAED